MNNSNRDLLVLFNQGLMTPQALEHEVGMLHELLYKVEQIDNLVTAFEVIDLVRYSVSSQSIRIKKYFRHRSPRPFIFLSNKN